MTLTVAELISKLRGIPDDCEVRAYEGEVSGIVIYRDHRQILFIETERLTLRELRATGYPLTGSKPRGERHPGLKSESQ